jgi:predicted nicotinamide N-methyase
MSLVEGRDRADFIRRHTRLLPVPLTPEISLHVADEATALWEKTEEELAEIGLPPPFWAFAWAGGQALARYILDRPALVRGQRVLDFASGSGLVAIAAARADALSVEASDIDAFAIAAIRLNAAANGVAVAPFAGDLAGGPCRWDVILAGDIAYEDDMTRQSWAGWRHLPGRGRAFSSAIPAALFCPATGWSASPTNVVPVTRALEDNEIKHTRVWRFRSADGDFPQAS